MSKLFLDQDQIGQLLECARKSPRDLAMFHVQLSTGLRISDVLRLKIRQLRDSDGEVVRALHIKMKKTGRWITRKLREDCRAALAEYLAARSDSNPYLFRPESNNQQGSTGPMNRASAHRVYKRYLAMLFPGSILQGASTHTMRRSVAKLISKRAGRIEPATLFLGHSSIATTMAYIDQGEIEQRADEIVLGELHW